MDKGCKDRKGKLYKVNKFVEACCFRYTCAKKGRKAFAWKKAVLASKCCQHEGNFYEVGATIREEAENGTCTSRSTRCVDVGGKASVSSETNHGYCCTYIYQVIPVGHRIPLP